MKNFYALLVAVSCVFAALAADLARPSVAFAHPAITTIAANIPVPATVAKENVVVLSDVKIVAQRPRRAPVSAKTWVCSAPRPLANDAHQTVRVCSWR